MSFLYALPGAVAEGLIWGLMAIGVYIWHNKLRKKISKEEQEWD